MDRRRALMAKGGADQSLKIGDLETASEVKLGSTSTVIYIYCGKMGGNALLLRKNCIDSSNKKFRSSGNPDYDGSTLDNYLVNDVYPTYGTLAKSTMVDTTFNITVGDGSTTTTKSITRKIFAPPFSMLGTYGTLAAVLKKYYNTTSANTARIAKDSGGTARNWWTCDASNATQVKAIASSGADGNYSVTMTSIYTRPCLTLDPNAKVALVDGVYILQED